MFTYRENRSILHEEGRLDLPGNVIVAIELSANPVLGDRIEGNTTPTATKALVSWNANTGRSTALAETPLPATDVSVEFEDMLLNLKGRVVTVQWRCESREELYGVPGALHFALPLVMGLEFIDPVTVNVTQGANGRCRFVWHVTRTGTTGENIDKVIRDERVTQALRTLPTLLDPRNISMPFFHRKLLRYQTWLECHLSPAPHDPLCGESPYRVQPPRQSGDDAC